MNEAFLYFKTKERNKETKENVYLLIDVVYSTYKIRGRTVLWIMYNIAVVFGLFSFLNEREGAFKTIALITSSFQATTKVRYIIKNTNIYRYIKTIE